MMVVDCPVCGNLHPVRFDGYAGIDGDYVTDCPECGSMELIDFPNAHLRQVVVGQPMELP
jgi:hypothetical protein